ncbi:pilus assembly protein PilO [Neobacillus kokaensis]|uniref:Pilus assembly protein PilO n=1 Tax=Neobacillus kokaensis TaxID=2759023 RepID=A0ABQ3MZM1_9BACI|nr:pilus assembly protein PilO [Neobacillus kokaensis]GHH97183.1 hypothetical protein AM1BK_07260 [Neobacillus kokaensis]
MKLSASKRNNLIIGAGALIVVLVIVIAQFIFLSPLKSDLKLKQESLQSEQKLLEIATQKKTVDANKTVEDTRELQKKLPVKSLVEQLILDLEKAETLSNSKINSMGFAKDADVGTGTDQANGQQNAAANQDTANQAAQNTDGQPAAPPTPAGMKKVTVNLAVESPSYRDFEKFVGTIESLKRIVVVESISYSGGKEVTTVDQEDQPLTFSLTISSFYMPDLTDLAADLPKIDSLKPAGKDNPLSQFPVVTNKP